MRDGRIEGDASVVVVSFPARTKRQGLDRAAFGEEYFTPRRISALLVTVADNHGFLNDDAEAMIAPVLEATRGFRSVVLYGSSMGAFAAIMLSTALRADRIIAIAPRYTGDWVNDVQRRANAAPTGEARRLTARMVAGLRPDASLFAIYDPTVAIDRHAAEAALARSRNPQRLLLPFAGHPPGRFLVDAKLLSGVIAGAIRGELDTGAVRRAARAARATVPAYWMNRSLALATRGGDPTPDARRAVALNPQEPEAHYMLGRALLRRRERAEAAECFARSIAMRPKLLKYRFEHAQALLRMRDWRKAHESFAAAAAAGRHDYRPQLGMARALIQLGRDAEALSALRRQTPRGTARAAAAGGGLAARPTRAAPC